MRRLSKRVLDEEASCVSEHGFDNEAGNDLGWFPATRNALGLLPESETTEALEELDLAETQLDISADRRPPSPIPSKGTR